MTSAVELPPSGTALDSAGTQEAVRRAERRIWLRFAEWFGGSLVVMLGTWLSGIDGLMALFVLALFTAGAFLTVHCRSLFWLGRVKRILRLYPWESRPHVRKRRYPNGGNTKVSAIVQLYDPVTKWSPELRARDVWCGLSWKATFDDGAWFAGDMPFGGVMAKPGGDELAFVVPQLMDELVDDRESADDARKERARQAKLGKQLI
jgi:hypothetical protein